METQDHRAFSGTCDGLTSAGEQLKSGSATHLVVREDNCGMAVRRTEWEIIGCRIFLNCAVTRFTPQAMLVSSCWKADRPAPRG
ncbi:uncharacterized protein BKA55DRAFT_582175 [Fusarium redolens]|uniref:Uncharacterized protein n=1 Tax=Fusarium redolens TaxID=48865 RepID=A0A9P9G395_FUSRE|nr:uncharacterized protein BKA55DRAFT_582175 [Fusarium redolens]KAH7231305.1 hypothetical protein BKA55DRAFT_582175 [Fusarium redolens]